MALTISIIILKEKLKKISELNPDRLSENAKSENIGIDPKNFIVS